jgi:hypothetical protein
LAGTVRLPIDIGTRFRGLAERLIPKLYARGIKTGIFGFTDPRCTSGYGDGPDHRRIMEVWQEYVRLGADILFVDEESGCGGLDVPASCLAHCDELRATFKLPVGLFLYGPASQAGQVRAIAPHVDVIGEMGYNLFLEARGHYGLKEVTRQWSNVPKGATDQPVAYWTGAMVMLEPNQQPGSPFWRERFGERTLAQYFKDYLCEARNSDADPDGPLGQPLSFVQPGPGNASGGRGPDVHRGSGRWTNAKLGVARSSKSIAQSPWELPKA